MKISIQYERTMSSENYRNWKNKRNTGLKVTWSHELSPQEEAESYYRFAEENKYFTLLANVIYKNGGITQDIEDLLKEITAEKKLIKPDCKVGQLSNKTKSFINKRFGNISHNSALYMQEISEEQLEIAARIYFDIVFCPNLDPETINFYQNLFKNFPLETILKTFTRILLEANKNKLENHYQSVKTLNGKTAEILNLQYRDIALLTTGQSVLEHYPELKDRRVNEEIKSKNEEFQKI